MSFKLKIIIIAIIILAGLIVVFNLLRDSGKNQDASPALPPAVEEFTDQQKQSIQQFVKNFLTLYNSYAYEDYSNLLAVGDYETQNAQKQTLDRIEKLKSQTPPGFQRTAQVDEQSTQIDKVGLIRSAVAVRVNILVEDMTSAPGPVSPRSADSSSSQKKTIQAQIKLVPYNKGWLVDDIIISE